MFEEHNPRPKHMQKVSMQETLCHSPFPSQAASETEGEDIKLINSESEEAQVKGQDIERRSDSKTKVTTPEAAITRTKANKGPKKDKKTDKHR